MNRFKFRIWDNNRKKFVSTHDGEQTPMQISKTGRLNANSESFGRGYFPERYILEQWTGLTDSKGKFIFEGDIVSYGACGVIFEGLSRPNTAEFNKTIRNKTYWNITEVVKWEDGGFNIKGNPLVSHSYCDGVVGNIHEHPDLIENLNKETPSPASL